MMSRSGFLRGTAAVLGAGATAGTSGCRPGDGDGDTARSADAEEPESPSFTDDGCERVTRMPAVTGPDVTTRFRMEATDLGAPAITDRKSTRLNSSHVAISYAVFCL